MTKLYAKRLIVVSALVSSCLLSRAAIAEDTATLNKVVELNRRALKTYDDLDMETAAKLLKQALELCSMEGLERHRAAARTHIHLGVVYVAGLKLRDQGLLEFRRAIGIDSSIRVTRSVSTPEIEAVFAEAQAKGGEAPSAATAPTPAASRAQAPANVTAPAATAKSDAINHPPVTEAQVGKSVEIKAQVPKGLHADKVVLAYRVGSDGEFLAREMKPVVNAPEWYHEKIPAEATQSDDVSYYIEAQDDDGQPLMASGTQTAPHVIKVVSEAADEAAETVRAAKGESGKESSSSPLWFVLAVGSGAGYFSGAPEMNSVDDNGKSMKSSGTEMAALGHLAPEVGFFYSEHLLLSVQGRLQYVTGSKDISYNGTTYKTSKTALAGLAKVSYFLTDASARFQPFVAAQAGVGEIRYAVSTSPLLGCGANGAAGACKDTVRGGLGLLGAAIGSVYMLSETVGVYAALNALVGAPNLVVDADLNVGISLIH